MTIGKFRIAPLAEDREMEMEIQQSVRSTLHGRQE